MKRFLAASLAVSAVALALAACDGGGYGRSHGGVYDDPCMQFSSCGVCTPAAGCGWCSTADGKGACVSDPYECASAPQFSWTWEPTGCPRVAADAGVPSDAAPSPVDASAPGADSSPVQGVDGAPEASADAAKADGGGDAGGD